LFIVSEIIQNLKKRGEKPISGLLFLHSDTLIRGIKFIMFAITIWAFKEFLLLLEEILKIRINLGDFLGIISMVLLSYGLFLIISPLKKTIKSAEEKKEKKDNHSSDK
jgi:large-conductance mechanosensitive channel